MWIKTIDASIASRPCGFDPLSQCYNKSIEGILAHIISLISKKHTFSSASSARSDNWFCNIYFLTTSLPAPVCQYWRHIFQYMLMTLIYKFMCVSPCTPLGIHHTTLWGVLTPLDLHVQISEFGACGFSWLLIRDAQ